MENMVGIRIGMFEMHTLIIFFVVGEISRNGLVGEWHFDGDAKMS